MNYHIKRIKALSCFFVLSLLALIHGNLTAQFTPGTSYFSSNGYIEYIAGNLPIVLSAPHGGYLKPAGIPTRTCSVCDTIQDSYTQELAREIKDSIFGVIDICNGIL